ncbi:MAG: efflux RND transporter periplasmic adaptor subunit [Ginsengibacter sp.]
MKIKVLNRRKWPLYILLLSSAFLIDCNQQPETNDKNTTKEIQLYTCSMHPQIISDKPGDCPICGMTLVKKESDSKAVDEVQLSTLLKPANQFVVSSIPVTTIKAGTVQNQMDVLGVTDYDTRMIGNIAARISGRIQRLYVKYAFQEIMQGQKVMDIYSPEVLTAEEDLLFLIKNDANNISLINTAKQKLFLLGVSSGQLQQIIKINRPSSTITVYSNYSGHIHDTEKSMSSLTQMKTVVTNELNIKEGMYVQKGQTVFSVYNPHMLAAILDIYPEQQPFLKMGRLVRIIPESAPGKNFSAKIDFIEPFFRAGSKTLKARVYFDNSTLDIPVGAQVRAIIFDRDKIGNWLPRESVLSLGANKIVFIKSQGAFQAHNVQTGSVFNDKIEIIKDLSSTDSVAVNAQYLMDGESIIRAK